MKVRRMTPFVVEIAIILAVASGCAEQQALPPAAPQQTPPGAVAPPPLAPTPTVAAPSAPTPAPAAPAATPLSPPIDEAAIASSTGVEKPEKSPDGTVKVTFPRKDVDVSVDGWKLPPFMGLTSWAAFTPAKAGVAEAMVMGDLVLFADEVNPVMSVLFDNGVEATALHNHFFFDAPNVYFMHIGGEGTVAGLGKGVRLAMEKVAEIRKRTPKPPSKSGSPALPAKSSIDAAKIEAALGVKGQAKDGMFKATMGRPTSAACGCTIGKAMGVNTWSAFAGTSDNAVVDGDFAVTDSELQGVLKALRAGNINVVAIHHHMTGETPRILFIHYWGRGKAEDLVGTIRKALDLTAWEGRTKSS